MGAQWKNNLGGTTAQFLACMKVISKMKKNQDW